MTLKELQREVLSLMFETELEDAEAFIHAANRALSVIYTESDRISEMYVYRHSQSPTSFTEHIRHKGSSDVKLNIRGKAFSFISSGVGTLQINDGEERKEIRFSKNREAIKEFISSGAAELCFCGEFDYDIFRLASFEGTRSSDKNDIELAEEYVKYDMRSLDPYFLAFLDEVRGFDGKRIQGSTSFSSIFKIPFDYEGEMLIKYKRRYKRLDIGDIDAVVDIDEECEHLLALLIASYLLSDDNPELSVYYMNLYKDAMTSVKIYNRKNPNFGYDDVLGWAK